MARSLTAAVAFLALGTMLWIGLTYTIFTALTVKRDKPPLEKGLTGGWLIAVVATQSIAVLAALIARDWPQPLRLELNFFALSMWLWGGMFYIWIISLIFLSLYVLYLLPRRPDASLLDQHGSDGDLNLGRRTAGAEHAGCAVPRLAAALHQGLHRLLLGDRDVVDSDAAPARRLAAPDPAVPAAI
jgi:hypothetical protein